MSELLFRNVHLAAHMNTYIMPFADFEFIFSCKYLPTYILWLASNKNINLYYIYDNFLLGGFFLYKVFSSLWKIFNVLLYFMLKKDENF